MSIISNHLQNPYVADILDQPEALQRSLLGFESSRDLTKYSENLSHGVYKRLILTGMGSSYFALYPLHLRLLEHRIASLMVETSELIHYMPQFLEPESLLIVVSQSGRSAEIVRLLKAARDRVQIISITNDESSPLATQSNAVVMIRAGQESTVSCKTYVSSLLALEWLGEILLAGDIHRTRQELSSAASATEGYLSNIEHHVDSLLSTLANTKHIFVTGRGSSLAAAGTGGLILKESVRFPAEGMSCASFRHGPFELLHSKVLVMVLGGDSRTAAMNRRLADDIVAAGARALLVQEGAEEPALRLPNAVPRIRPILEMLPIQLISLAIAVRDGVDAGQFQLASKITTIE